MKIGEELRRAAHGEKTIKTPDSDSGIGVGLRPAKVGFLKIGEELRKIGCFFRQKSAKIYLLKQIN